MTFGETAVLAFLVFATAMLYSAVGQAGASGYLAVMGLAGLAPHVIKPAALALNVLVAAIGMASFARAGYFQWRTFYPFAVLGVPFSFIGGSLTIPPRVYYPLVGTLLLVAAAQLARSARARPHPAHSIATTEPYFVSALLAGAAVGLLSGLTGTGGGIFLAPLILAMGWLEAHRAAAVTAGYNLLNSAAALCGAWTSAGALPEALPTWLAVAACGAMIGSQVGTRLPPRMLKLILALILAVAGAKMILT